MGKTGPKARGSAGGGHSNHVLVRADPPVLLTTRTATRGACAVCARHTLQLNKASYFGTVRGSLYAYAICAACARSACGGRKLEVRKSRTGCGPASADATGTEATLVYIGQLSCAARDQRKLKFTEVTDPGALLMDPAKAKRVCRGSETLPHLVIGAVSERLAQLLNGISQQGGGERATITKGAHTAKRVETTGNAPLRGLLVSTVRALVQQGRLKLAAEGDIQVTGAFLITYREMECLREFHWDAKRNTYGNLLIRVGSSEYLGGDTLLQHGRVRLHLEEQEAAIWTNYDSDGRLLEDAIHAAGLVFSGTKRVLAAFWEVEGFARPTDIEEQATTIANSSNTHHGVRGNPIKFV